MENQIAPRADTKITGPNNMSYMSGLPAEVLSSDLTATHIILGQGLSDAVVSKKVEVGDIYRAGSNEILGNTFNPSDVVFLHYPTSQWVLEKKPKGSERWKYDSVESRDAKNERAEFMFFADENGSICKNQDTGEVYEEGDKGAIPWRRVKRLRAFAILLKDLEQAQAEMEKAARGELPDPSKAVVPVCFSFKNTSYKAGKGLIDFVLRAAKLKQPVWRYVIKMGSQLEKNDDGTFSIWTCDASKPTGVPEAQMEQVQDWAMTVNGNIDKIKTEGEEVIE